MSFLDQLNPEQREAVLQTDGPLLILAGAGSGKTRVIAYRIAHLVGSALAAQHEVLAVTFTNKAAEEMRARVEAVLRLDCRSLWVSTFHSLCARLLRREGPAIGLPRSFVIYDAVDQLAAVKTATRDLGIDDKLVPPRVALARISQAKNRLEGPESLNRSGWNFREEQIGRIYGRYLELLEASSALDFDDLLLKTVQLFDTSPAVRERYARQFRYVMVDEYQDTNRPQYLLVRRLAAEHRNLAVVGDPDQSIYGWRGADLRNILDFERDFPETRVVRLERNYRSTQVILDAASAVIRQNRDRKEKRLWTEQQGGAPIEYFRGQDDLEEADFVTRSLRRALFEGPEGAVAVLYRINAQSRTIEDSLVREGVPYRMVGGVRFYERREIKDALAYLKLLINPHDDVAFRRVVNTPARGIGRAVMDALDAAGQPDQVHDPVPLVAAGLQDVRAWRSLWARTEHLLDSRRLPARSAGALARFRDLILRLTEIARSERVSVTVARVLDLSGYLDALRAEQSEEAAGRIDNLHELVSAANEYESRESDASLGGFVDRLSLLSDVDEITGAEDARVWLLTLHAAKGLEFPTVIIVGMEEGLFPLARAAESESDLEEERRLCYVGMTRAQRLLIMSGAARRRVFGEYQASQPSRFLEEIPRELVRWQESFSATSTARVPPWREAPRGRRQPAARADEVDAGPMFSYEDENQAAGGSLRAGMRVRHPRFGVGTVLSVEPANGDTKLTVRFASVGAKKLLASFAQLDLA